MFMLGAHILLYLSMENAGVAVQDVQSVQVRCESPPGVAKNILPPEGKKKTPQTTCTRHGAEHRGIEMSANGSTQITG